MRAIRVHFVVLLLCTSSITLFCQTVSFTYDNAGNRLSRTLDEEGGGGLKSLVKSDTLEVEEETIEEEMINAETKIFPNPTHGNITIDFWPENTEVEYSLSVNNLSGYELINKRIFEGKNHLDLSKYPSGTYLITIYSKDKYSKWIILKI